MKPVFALSAALVLIASPSLAKPLEGTLWRTQGGDGLIRIEACGNKTCGRIVNGTPRPGEGGLDAKNPNPTLRTRPLAGLAILSGFTQAKDQSYKGGTIYNPNDGKTYRSEFRLKPDGRLEVKGCVGPFCQSQIWTAAR
jgi:uncharacterized protein (DUF2147 family)